MQNQYICVLPKFSERSKTYGILFQRFIHLDVMWMVWLYIAVCGIKILMHMYWLQNCYYLDSLTSCHLKGFPDRWGFIFRVVFLSSPCSVELKLFFGPVAPPIDHLCNGAWPRTGHCPLSPLYQLLEQQLQPLVLHTSCVPACVR